MSFGLFQTHMTFEKVVKNFSSRGLRLKNVQRYLDAGGDINHRDEKMGWSLLHYAAEDSNPEVIKLLAIRGANINATDVGGWTPLHYAVDIDMDSSSRNGRRAKELPTVQALIDAGASENIKGTDGTTPRDIAIAYREEALYDSLSRPKTT
jgi:ankyrin repeat protein